MDNASATTAYQKLYAPGSAYHRVVSENTSAGEVFRKLSGNITINNQFTLVNTNTSVASKTVFDAEDYALGGAANVFMSSGTSNPCTLRIARTGVTVPEFTGTYTLNDRTTKANQPTLAFYADGNQTVRALNNYRNMHFLGLGTKTISGSTTSTAAAANTSEIVIDAGVVDVVSATDHLLGNSSLVMNGGRLEVATTGAVVPEVTGTYTLSAGRVVIDGTGAQTVQSSTAGTPTFIGNTYHELEFTGSGIKTVEGSGDVVANNGLFLSLPNATGNHVNANGNTVQLTRPTTTSLVRFPGGHVVGNLNRYITGTNTYHYPVGSDLGPGTVYYEPLYLKVDDQLVGTNDITVAFAKGISTGDIASEAGLPLAEGLVTYSSRELEGIWQVTPNAEPSAGNYSIEVTPSAGWSFISGTRTLAKRADAASSWAWAGSSPVSANERSGYTTFSEVSIVSGDIVLPIEAAPLSATPLASAISVNWRTLTEINSVGFELERGLDATSFEKIAFIKSAGMSDTPRNYNHVDYQVAPNVTYYYRYQAKDMDGKTYLSNVASARLVDDNKGNRFTYSVFPNPAHTQAVFSLSLEAEAHVQVAIYDATGRLISTPMRGRYPAGQSGFTWHLQDVASGIYMLQISVNDQMSNAKLIVR